MRLRLTIAGLRRSITDRRIFRRTEQDDGGHAGRNKELRLQCGSDGAEEIQFFEDCANAVRSSVGKSLET